MTGARISGKLLRNAAALLLVLLALIAAAEPALRYRSNHSAYFGLYHDDAVYVVTARALAEGDGYKIISLPGAPVQTKYPILYPLLLSLLWRLEPRFPENIPLLESSGLLCGFLFAAVSALYLLKTRRCTPLMSSVIFGATILNVRFLSFLPLTMSDFLYGVLSVTSLWSAEITVKRIRQGNGRLASVMTGIFAALSALTRSVGTLIGPLALLYFFRVRNRTAAALFACSFMAAMVPYWWWHSVVAVPMPDWISYYTDYAGWMSETYSRIGSLSLLWRKFNDIFIAVPRIVCPLLDVVPYSQLTPVQFFVIYRAGFLMFWIGVVLGSVRDLRFRRWSLLPIYFALYWTGMLVWPGLVEWRLVLVVLPFFYYYAFCAFRIVACRFKPPLLLLRRDQFLRVNSFAAVIFAVYLLLGSALLSCSSKGLYPKLVPALWAVTSEQEQHDVRDSYEWIRSNTELSDVFVCSNDPVLFLYTGRRAVQPSPYQGWRLFRRELVTPETVLSAISGSSASYLLLDPSFGGAYEVYLQYGAAISRLSKIRPALLVPVYASPHGVMSIFRINRPASAH